MNTLHVRYNQATTLYFYLKETQSYAGGNPITGKTAYAAGSGSQDLWLSWSTDSGTVYQEYPTQAGVAAISEFDSTKFPGVYEVTINAAVTNGSFAIVNLLCTTSDDTSEPMLLVTDNLQLSVDVKSISGDSAAANNLESAFDGTGYGIQPSSAATAVLADVTKISGDSTAANNAELYFDGTGYGIQPGSSATTVDVGKISGDATAADNAESFFDGTGYAGGSTKLTVDVTAISGDTTAANNAELFFDGTGYGIQPASNATTVDVGKISGDATAADNAELFFDGTGYAGGTAKLQVDVTKISGDSTAANNAELYFDGTGYGIQPASNATTVDVGKISGSATAADNLEASALGIVPATVDTGSFTATTSQFQSDTGGLSSVDGHYTGRVAVFTSGTLASQAADITGYDGSNKRFTCSTLTSAPANDVTLVLV